MAPKIEAIVYLLQLQQQKLETGSSDYRLTTDGVLYQIIF